MKRILLLFFRFFFEEAIFIENKANCRFLSCYFMLCISIRMGI